MALPNTYKSRKHIQASPVGRDADGPSQLKNGLTMVANHWQAHYWTMNSIKNPSGLMKFCAAMAVSLPPRFNA